MSADSRVARRYAAALFNAAGKSSKVDAVQDDLLALSALWTQVPAMRRALESPLVPSDRKRAVIREAFSSQLGALTLRFLNLLVEKRREEVFPEVVVEYVRLADVARRLVRAEVTVARPMDDLERAAMIEALERRTGKTVHVTVNLDPDIIGGAIVRMEDTVIDGSVRGSLERIREQMLHGL